MTCIYTYIYLLSLSPSHELGFRYHIKSGWEGSVFHRVLIVPQTHDRLQRQVLMLIALACTLFHATTHSCRQTLMMTLCHAVTWWIYAANTFGVDDCCHRLADRTNSFPIDISWAIPIIHHHRHTLSASHLSSRSISHDACSTSNYLAGTYQVLHTIIVYHTRLL